MAPVCPSFGLFSLSSTHSSTSTPSSSQKQRIVGGGGKQDLCWQGLCGSGYHRPLAGPSKAPCDSDIGQLKILPTICVYTVYEWGFLIGTFLLIFLLFKRWIIIYVSCFLSFSFLMSNQKRERKKATQKKTHKHTVRILSTKKAKDGQK